MYHAKNLTIYGIYSMNDIAEYLLLCNPKLRNYYLIRYELYTLLILPMNLFTNEDIYNYKGEFHTIQLINYKPQNLWWEYPRPYNRLGNVSLPILDLEGYAMYFSFLEKRAYIIDTDCYDNIDELDASIIRRLILSIVSENPFTEKQLEIIQYVYRKIQSIDNHTHNILDIIQSAKSKYYE